MISLSTDGLTLTAMCLGVCLLVGLSAFLIGRHQKRKENQEAQETQEYTGWEDG